mmetsp:Transcript_34775/g.61205  ORF Transcript_34775/g.61205 Transcript_34775/m.61205 type:complete len:227 (+) Transcript_34775:511-1191(+)
MMSRDIAVENDRSFIESLGLPELVHHRNIPKDIFFKHKRFVHKALRPRPSSELRSQSVRTPAQHMRVEKDFDVKYEDLYKNHAARLREKRRGEESCNTSFITESKTPMRSRRCERTPSLSHMTSNSSFKTSRTNPKTFEKQSASFIAHAVQTFATEKENTSGLYNKCRKDFSRPTPDPIKAMERGVFSQDFVKDALDDYKKAEKKLFIHTNAGANFRHRTTLRKLL